MKTRLICLILTVLLLSACTGEAPPPTETLVAPTTEPSPTDITEVVDSTAEPTINSPFPTLEVRVYPTDPPRILDTPDPNAPTSEPTGESQRTLVFETLTLTRTGGPTLPDGSSVTERIVLTRNGGIQRNEGPAAQLTQDRVNALTELIRAANLFDVDGVFLGAVPAEGPMPYLYQLRIESEGYERLLTLQDGNIPREIQSLIGELLSLGLAQRGTP